MFDAQEWLQSVTAAVRTIKSDAIAIRDARRRLESLGSVVKEVVVKSTPSDSTDKIDAVLDLEAERSSRLADANREVANARLVFEGMRRIGKLESNAADVLELVHASDMSKHRAAKRLRVSGSTLQRRYAYGIDWLNAHGLAYAKQGVGRAT